MGVKTETQNEWAETGLPAPSRPPSLPPRVQHPPATPVELLRVPGTSCVQVLAPMNAYTKWAWMEEELIGATQLN